MWQCHEGQVVYWRTGECSAVVLEMKDSGDIIIQPKEALIPITTRAAFLEPIEGWR